MKAYISNNYYFYVPRDASQEKKVKACIDLITLINSYFNYVFQQVNNIWINVYYYY